MTTEQEALRVLSQILPPNALDEGQTFVFRRAWLGKNYTAIAKESHYTYGYIRKTAASLWQILSEILGVEVTKGNFRTLLKNVAKQSPSHFGRWHEVPGGPVPLDSPFYVTRPLIEAKAVAEIARPGGVLRLKAPQKMGKSTLMLRLIEQALSLNYRPIFLDLQLVDRGTLADANRFLRWFCASLSHRLGLTFQFDQYDWDVAVDSKINSFVYLQDYLLPQMKTPVVVLVNEVNRIVDYSVLAQAFLGLIQSLHQAAQYRESLQKLRLVLAYSLEINAIKPLQLNQPAFDAGLLIELPELSLAEIQTLAQSYGLDWTNPLGCQQALTLYQLVGGYPYLVQLALYHLTYQSAQTSVAGEPGILTLDQLLAAAPTLSGIYSDYLQRQLSMLYAYPELMLALQQVLANPASTNTASTNTAAELPPLPRHKLQSLGLIKLEGTYAVISCELYRRFFSRHLSPTAAFDWSMLFD